MLFFVFKITWQSIIFSLMFICYVSLFMKFNLIKSGTKKQDLLFNKTAYLYKYFTHHDRNDNDTTIKHSGTASWYSDRLACGKSDFNSRPRKTEVVKQVVTDTLQNARHQVWVTLSSKITK